MASFVVFKDGLHAHHAASGFADIGPSFGYVFRLLLAAPRSLREVAEALHMTPPGALKIIEDMITKGYVERRDDPDDGRVTRLALTKRGHKAIATARAFHQSFEQELSDHVGAAKARACREALENILARYGEPQLRPT